MKKLFPTAIVSYLMYKTFVKMFFSLPEYFWALSFIWILLFFMLFRSSDYSKCMDGSGQPIIWKVIVMFIALAYPMFIASIIWILGITVYGTFSVLGIIYVVLGALWVIIETKSFIQALKK